MPNAKDTTALRTKLIDELEAAQAAADELGDGVPGIGLNAPWTN